MWFNSTPNPPSKDAATRRLPFTEIRLWIISNAATDGNDSIYRQQEFGSVGEWLKPSDCKSDLNRTLVRIQPEPPNKWRWKADGFSTESVKLVLTGVDRNHTSPPVYRTLLVLA